MKSFSLGTYALTVGVAVALLAGCGGSQPPIGAPSTVPQTSANATPHRSWQVVDVTEAKNEDLIYAVAAAVGLASYRIPKANSLAS